MKKQSKLQFIRTVVQVIGFVLYSGVWAMVFNAINQIYLRLMTGAPAGAELFAYMVEALAIIPVTIIFGRFFCGWLCAFGSFTDFVYSISSKFFKRKMPANIDAKLKYIKYFVLAFIVVILWNGLLTTTQMLSPWDSFARIFSFNAAAGGFNFAISIPVMSIGTILFLMIIVGSMFIERFFCRYLCPLGAFFAVTSKLRVFKIKKPTENCGSCRSCTNNCPMGIEMYKKEKIGSGECIMCMKCTSACPRANTKLSVYATDISPAIAAGIALSTMVGAYSIDKQLESRINPASNRTSVVAPAVPVVNKPALKAAPKLVRREYDEDEGGSRNYTPVVKAPVVKTPTAQTATTTATTYKDGTFSGTAYGFNGPVNVNVTISGSKITSVVVTSNSDYPTYFSRAENKVVPATVSAQTPNVSGASGATYSSEGIKNAVADALAKAKI